MALFEYKAVASDGAIVNGEMEAPDAHHVISQLQASDLLPIDARPKTELFRLHELARGLIGQRKTRISAAEVTAITRELATLQEAHLPLDASLRTLEKHLANDRLKNILHATHESVRSGKSFSTALAQHNDVFDPLYLSLIRAGEASGRLDLALARLADYRERSEAFRSSVVAALTYPAILTAVAFLSLFVLITFVVPRFVPLFEDQGAVLPLLTRIVFGAAELMRSFWWAVVGAIALMGYLFRYWLEKPGNRLRFDRRRLTIPVFGEVERLIETARFARTLASLLNNGLPLHEALRLVHQVIRNAAMAEGVATATEAIQSGGRLSDSLRKEGVLPGLVIDLVHVGEESGRIEQMLEKAAETVETRVQSQLKKVLTLLEPVLILSLGALIAIVIVAILMAMLGLNELVA